MNVAGDPFVFKNIVYIRNVDDSMRPIHSKNLVLLSPRPGCAKRVLHHLRNNCEDPRNTILIVGFMAENTLGRRIVERQPEIKIFGVKRQLRAEVAILNSFSAHAGRSELLEFGARFQGKNKRVLLVHGEEKALKALQTGLTEKGVAHAQIMEEKVPVTV